MRRAAPHAVPAAFAPRAFAPLVLGPLLVGPFLVGPFLVGSADPAEAQVAGGPEVTATISQRFEIDSNLDLDDPSPGTSTFADTRFALGLLEEQPDRRFTLGFDTGLRALWQAEEDFEFTFASPSTASVGYTQEWAAGSIDTAARYRQRRVDFTRNLADFIDPDLGVIVVPDDPEQLEGDATERRYDASLALAFATDAPSSYALSFSGTRFDYTEETANLTPRTTLVGAATWNLQFNPVIAGTLTTRGLYYEAEDAAETEIREAEIDAGFVYDPNAVLRLTGGAAYVDRTRRQRPTILGTPVGPRETIEDETGVALRAGVRYAFEEVTINGALRLVTVPDSRLSGNVGVTYPLPNGRVTGRLFQNIAGGTAGDEIRVTGAGIGFLRELDRMSRVNVDFAVSRRENLDDPADDPIDRFDFATTLGYDITETITADIGYRFRLRDEGPESADSHAVFVQIGRTFVTGF